MSAGKINKKITKTQEDKGIIIGSEDDSKKRRALSVTNDIEFY